MRKLALSFCAVSFATVLDAAPPPWLEVKSGHFTVITNSGEKSGRHAAWEFEQIRAALLTLWPWAKIDVGQPFIIFAARDEETLKTLGPQFWEGKRYRPTSFWVGGRDRHFIALRTDISGRDEFGVNPYHSAYWSYAASVFSRSFPRRPPLWYFRGVAEVISNTIVREKELRVGIPTRENVRLVRNSPVIPLNEFLSADERSRWRTQETDAQLFDAQAWALVHYLMFGDKGALSGKLNQFNRLLYEGTAPDTAVREALGEIKPYYDGVRGYVQQSVFSYSTVSVSTDTRQEAYATRTLTAAEAAAQCGQLLVAMNRPAEARALAAEAAKAEPNLPGPWEIEAELLDHESHGDEARAAFGKAAAAGSKKAYVYYRLAQLEWTHNADKALLERLATSLEKARELEPDGAHILSFLAGIRTELGQPEEALGLAKKAVEIEPARSYHRLSLARVLWSLRRREEAVRVAETALQAADGEGERRAVQSFLDFAGRARPAP